VTQSAMHEKKTHYIQGDKVFKSNNSQTVSAEFDAPKFKKH